jgi:hypothetical protein
MIDCSLGNWPVLSFEYTNSPFADSSKHPPPDGTSVKFDTFCLNVLSTRLAKLTACGS